MASREAQIRHLLGKRPQLGLLVRGVDDDRQPGAAEGRDQRLGERPPRVFRAAARNAACVSAPSAATACSDHWNGMVW